MGFWQMSMRRRKELDLGYMGRLAINCATLTRSCCNCTMVYFVHTLIYAPTLNFWFQVTFQIHPEH